MRRRKLAVKNMKKLVTRLGLMILALLLIIGLIVGVVALIRGAKKSGDLTPLGFTAENMHLPTGSGLLYLVDGQLSYKDLAEKKKDFSIAVASDGIKLAGYNDTAVVYNAAAMQIVGAANPVEFSGQVMEVKCGSSHVAVLHLSAGGTTSLIIYDTKGVLQDEIVFESRYLTDFGFYGEGGSLLWTLELDTTGSIPNSTLTTYDLSKGTTTGVIPIQGQLAERIVMTGSSTYVCGTNSLVRYRDNSEAYRIMVYGWELLDVSTSGQKPSFLYRPRSDEGQISTVEVHTVAEEDVAGESKRQLQLPEDTFAAYLSGSRVAAFAPGGVSLIASDGSAETVKFDFTADSAVKLNETNFLVLGTDGAYLVTL